MNAGAAGGCAFFSESSANIGGQELQLLLQAQGLAARGWRVRILCRPASRIAEEAMARGLAVDLVPFRNAAHWPSLRRVAALVREHRPLGIVCHSGHDANVCVLAVRACAALGLVNPRPALVRVRTYQPGKAGAFGYNHLFDTSFTPSGALRAQLLANPRIKPQRVQVLYPGIDFDRIARDAQAPLPPELQARIGARRVIAHAAMLRGEKGHDFMLGVVQALRDRVPGVLYVAAGEGPLRGELEARVRALALEESVAFTGMLQPVAPLLRRADVVVMPSRYEPLGMSQVEALSLGTPVVVSDVGGLPETVEDGVTGAVCPHPDAPGALEAWVDRLAQLLQSPEEAKSMALLGKDKVLGQFDRDANLERLERALQGRW